MYTWKVGIAKYEWTDQLVICHHIAFCQPLISRVQAFFWLFGNKFCFAKSMRKISSCSYLVKKGWNQLVKSIH